MEIPKLLKCLKCRHEWIRRLNFDPKACPKCKSYNWNKKEVK